MKTHYLILLTLLFCLFNVNAAKESIVFQKIAFEDYLYNRNVKRVFQDKHGYVWLGTESGIYRYDGYKLFAIKSNINHPNLLTSGNILCIAEDHEGNLWFGTDRGVNVIDQNNRVLNLFENQSIQELRINSILCDKEGNVWIGSEKGLFVYNYNEKKIKSYCNNETNTNSLPGSNINYIFQDKDGIIWVALWEKGLCVYDKLHKNFKILPPLGKKNNPFSIIQDRDGFVWVGTWIDGLFKIDTKKGKYNYQQFKHDSNDPQSLADNTVYSLVEDNKGKIWILSQLGLGVIPNKNKFTVEKYNIQAIFKEGSNFLNHLFKDQNGNIWIATNNDGVYLAILDKLSINSNNLNELKSKFGYITVDAIIEDQDKILLGLITHGLYEMDKKTQHIKKISSINSEGAIQLPFVTDMSFCRNKSDNSIWVGGSSNLYRLIRKNNKYSIVNLKINSTYNIKPKGRMKLFCDSKNRMWIGSRYSVLLFINNEFREISSTISNISSICEDKNGYIWLGSTSQGVFRLKENANHKFEIKNYCIKNHKINSNQINSILIDKYESIWVGTDNGGLNKFDPNSDQFTSQNEVYNIQDEDIKSILEDNDGSLWISSNDKIIKINIQNLISYLFSENDNERRISYRQCTAYKGSDGKLYFGGGNGFNAFFPIPERQESQVSNVAITDIEINNQSIWDETKNHYDRKKNELVLNFTQRNVGFGFSSLNFVSPRNIRYAYKLDGVDDKWVNVGSQRRFASYNNLKMGNYTFEIKSTDENGKWQSNITKLKLIVEPAPWETWWAYLIYISLVTLISYIIYRNIKNRVLLKRDLLISKIDKEKTEELTQAKLRYFTNISHELLTPLTIISCLIDDFHFTNPDKFSQYNIMKSNINRLKRLLQQILDFRKVESGNMRLNVTQNDLVQFVENICWNNFNPLATKKNIQFSINAPQTMDAWFDADKIDKILFNLLSNSFKHTSEKGVINVTIQSTYRNEIEFAEIFVSDTGLGIPHKNLPYIFDRFYGNERAIESNGIGLSLTKDLVELHKGVISVESQENIGTTFMISIPIDRHIYGKDTFDDKDLDDNLEIDNTIIDENPTKLVKNDDLVILVVEDNPDLIMIIANTLSRLYKVITAGNGIEALSILKDKEIDLVVSDIMMPEMDGITLCKVIKEDLDYSHIPVLLLTAKNQIADRIESYNAGADAYISKPFEVEVLIARINSLILNRQARSHKYKSSLQIHPKELEAGTLDQKFLETIIQMIEDNLDNYDFTHEQLISNLNTSKSTMYRKIKSLTGLSPSEFVRNIRLKHACIMLQNDTGNISEIAFAVGFNDPKYFSTCFKAEFGVSPREFTKKSNG
ncbi:MAG: hybrid sensor histidine kinase/response regulator transcription factor [Bacteroidales bacterium]